MQLGDAQTGLLEDCFEDWRGLWEITWSDPAKSIEKAIAFLAPLVAAEYLTTLAVTEWEQARTAIPMAVNDALAVVREAASYAPPTDAGEVFYLLSITAKGEAAIPSGAFPIQAG